MKMNIKIKALITFLLVGTVVTVITLQTNNSNLFKGQIFNDTPETPEATESKDPSDLPDLTADITATMPVNPADDIIANVTIKNAGPGIIDGKTPFKYALSINGTEVMSNTDSYTTMNAGDSFTFSYPISRNIYNYKNIGSIKIIVDSDNGVKEADEENNMKETEY